MIEGGDFPHTDGHIPFLLGGNPPKTPPTLMNIRLRPQKKANQAGGLSYNPCGNLKREEAKMNCPNCGTETFADQQYCRTCGAGLTDGPPSAFNVRAWGLAVLMMIFGGLLIAMGGKLWAVKWVIFTGLLIMFAGIFITAAYGLLRQMSPRRSKPRQEPETQASLRADTTNKLLPVGENDFIPSAVEGTTDLLQVPASRDSGNVNR